MSRTFSFESAQCYDDKEIIMTCTHSVWAISRQTEMYVSELVYPVWVGGPSVNRFTVFFAISYKYYENQIKGKHL